MPPYYVGDVIGKYQPLTENCCSDGLLFRMAQRFSQSQRCLIMLCRIGSAELGFFNMTLGWYTGRHLSIRRLCDYTTATSIVTYRVKFPIRKMLQDLVKYVYIQSALAPKSIMTGKWCSQPKILPNQRYLMGLFKVNRVSLLRDWSVEWLQKYPHTESILVSDRCVVLIFVLIRTPRIAVYDELNSQILIPCTRFYSQRVGLYNWVIASVRLKVVIRTWSLAAYSEAINHNRANFRQGNIDKVQ